MSNDLQVDNDHDVNDDNHDDDDDDDDDDNDRDDITMIIIPMITRKRVPCVCLKKSENGQKVECTHDILIQPEG